MTKVDKAYEALNNGGMLTEEVGDDIKVHLVCDPQNPLAMFDKLNELEIEMVKKANNDIDKVKRANEFVDDLRRQATQALLSVGIDIEKLKNDGKTQAG